MSHLGLIRPELIGHLNPMTTLGRELKRRGHRVTVIALVVVQVSPAGNALLDWLARPIISEIDRHRAAHGLPTIIGGLNGGSRLAQIAQQPAFFDFPRRDLPAHFHYTGPWHDGGSGDTVDFPWEKLEARPLIYGSMGTLQNRQEFIFATGPRRANFPKKSARSTG